jgi:hypothetical protein
MEEKIMFKQFIIGATVVAMFTGCVYTDSALQYAEVQNKRVQAGYTTKQEMTKEIMMAVKEMNKDCGVKVEMVNGVPVTNVKQCISIHEAMASVGEVQIQRAEGIESVGAGTAKVLTSAATLAVPLGTAYMQYDAAKANTKAQVQITESNNAANVAMNQSNNEMNSNMIDSYTGNFQNTTETVNTTVTDTSTVDTSTIETTNTTNTTDTSVTDTSTVNPTEYTDGTISITNP